MNKYGRQAQEAWKAVSPTRYSQIQDPEDFFTKLGEEAQEQVDGLLLKIAGPDPQGEGYLEKVGRLNSQPKAGVHTQAKADAVRVGPAQCHARVGEPRTHTPTPRTADSVPPELHCALLKTTRW